jgi:hypothetical protein
LQQKPSEQERLAMREPFAALPHTEAVGLAVFILIILAFMVSVLLSWWKERRRIKK